MQWSPIVLQRAGGAGFGIYPILGLVILVIDILIIVNIWRSHKALIPKVVWTLVIIFLSFIGWILYFLLGREK